MKRFGAFLILVFLLCGCAVINKVLSAQLGGPCYTRRSDRDELCKRYPETACGPNVDIDLVGGDVCYTPDKTKFPHEEIICPDPPPPYHCDGDKRP